MSWTDEEIDQLFQEGANAQSFEYDNAYFSEIEAALPVNGKGKDFLWMGTAVLFIAALTTGFFMNTSDGNTFSGANGQMAKQEVDTKLNKEVEAVNSTENQLTIDSKTDKELNSASVEATGNTNESLNAEQSSYYTPQQQKGWKHSMYNWTSDQIVTAKKNVSQQSEKAQTTSGNNPILGVSTAQQGREDVNQITLENPKSTTLTNDIFKQSKTPITAGLMINSADQLDQGLDRSLVANALPLPLLTELRPKAGFYAELNGGLSQSLVTPSNYSYTSVGGGLGVETYLGNFNLTTGLNFIASDHKDLFLTSPDTQYGFGSTGKIDTYDFRRLYALELPISIGYNFGRHNVNLGVRPSMLLGSKMKHQAFEDEVLLRSRESNGLLDNGLRRFGLKPMIGYSYRLDNWVVGGNVGVQMLEAVDEQFIESVNNRFPVDGQIYLRRIIRLRK